MIQKVDIKIKDLLKLLYFIISKFEQDSSHRQGTSSKDDLIGGFIDRWINKLPESLIFNNLLFANKNYSVIPDYFIYNKNLAKNAPDVLGLKCRNGKIIKFAEFIDNTWIAAEGMPYLEVKTNKKNQRLFGVRNSQLKREHYYIIVESDIKPNYLKSVFASNLFEENNLKSILMDNNFIKKDPANTIKQPSKIYPFDIDEQIGTLKVVNIIKGKDLLLLGNRCKEKEGIYYIKDIKEKDRITNPNSDEKFIKYFFYNEDNGLFEKTFNGKQIVRIKAKNAENIKIRKINKGSIYIETEGKCAIYDIPLKSGRKYKIEISLFDRSSSWVEHIAYKDSDCNIDRTEELISLFDDIYLRNNIRN